MPEHISCGTVVYRWHGNQLQVLILWKKACNTWHLPKGTQKPGETIEETAVRETREEAGLDVQLEFFVGTRDSTFEREKRSVSKATHYYLATEVGGSIDEHDNEHDVVEYVEADEAVRRLQAAGNLKQEWPIVVTAIKLIRGESEL